MRNLSIFIIGLLLFSCNSNSAKFPGICLSFDDRSINEWFRLRELFNNNGVKVTFFITQPDSLNEDEITKLKILQKDGHEIGYHGNLHVASEYFIKENSYLEYIDTEINQGIETMESLGFNCVSFAYPYGAKYWFTDFILSKKFDLLRGVSPLNEEKDLTNMDEIYYSFDDDKTLSAMGFDVNSGVTKSMIDNAIERSIINQEVLLLYAHLPTTIEQQSGYSFDVDLLRHIIQQANKRNVGFYPIRELNNEVQQHL